MSCIWSAGIRATSFICKCMYRSASVSNGLTTTCFAETTALSVDQEIKSSELPVALLSYVGVDEITSVMVRIHTTEDQLSPLAIISVSVEPEGEDGLIHLALRQKTVPHGRHAEDRDSIEAQTKDAIKLYCGNFNKVHRWLCVGKLHEPEQQRR